MTADHTEVEIKNDQLRRNLNITEQEKSFLILENRKLLKQLETLQIQLAGSKTKMKEELVHLETELQNIRILHRDFDKNLKETQEALAMKNEEVHHLKEELDKQKWQCISQSQNDAEHAQALIAKADPARFPLQTADQPETVLNLQLNKMTEEEKQHEDEESLAAREFKKTEQRVLKATQDIQIHQRHTAQLSVTQLQEEMNKCRSELSEKERELLRIRRASGTKASQLAQMEKMLQETKSMLEKKDEMVSELEEKVQRSKRERRNSLHRTQLLESQMKTVRGELMDTLEHLQSLRDVLRRSQQKAEERQATMEKLTSELRETRGQVELLRNEVKDKDEAIKESEHRLQQTAQEASVLKFVSDESLEEKARNEESQLQSSFSTLTQKLQACQTQHQARIRAEVPMVSDHCTIDASQHHLNELRCRRAQLVQTFSKIAALLDEMQEQEQLQQYTSDALMLKESEITRLKMKLSSIERSTKQLNTLSSDMRSDLSNLSCYSTDPREDK